MHNISQVSADTLDVSAIRTDGGTQPRAAIFQNVIDDYADAITAGANFPPVTVFYDGTDYWLADGFHRHGAHRKLGLADIEADIRQGARREAVLFSVGANDKHGLRRTNEDKRRAVTTLLSDDEWARWSDREIARRAGVSDKTVGSLRYELSAEFPQIERPRLVERNGTVYEQNTARIGIIPEVRITNEPSPIEQSPWNEPANDNTPHVRGTLGTGENEWYTPAHFIELARSTMGTIDVDPASNPIAQSTVKATTYYTEETNGLDKDWLGNVWCNPPYAQPAIAHFADKMVEEVANGNTKEAVMLTHNYTDTAWFQKLARAASAICFTRGRVRFESPTGEKASPTQGQAFFYFGKDASRFIDVFRDTGFVVEVK